LMPDLAAIVCTQCTDRAVGHANINYLPGQPYRRGGVLLLRPCDRLDTALHVVRRSLRAVHRAAGPGSCVQAIVLPIIRLMGSTIAWTSVDMMTSRYASRATSTGRNGRGTVS
jgi:hypothetical protein